jgi:hypothetical protein
MNPRRGSAFSTSLLRKRNLGRIVLAVLAFLVLRSFFSSRQQKQEIKHHNVLERVTRPDRTLDVQRHDFLQVRMGGALPKDILDDMVYDGMATGNYHHI